MVDFRLHQRLFVLLSSVWLVSLLVAFPSARSASSSAQAGNAHEDLSLFTHSDDCVACHNNLTTAAGADVSIGATWRSTMMANAARDPYWQASVRRETMDHPRHAGDIQDECAGCHMPMAQRIAHETGGSGEVFAFLPFGNAVPSALHRLAADGVSCTVCHQIAAEGLGTPESFNARFRLTSARPGEGRVIFGPYTIDAGRQTIMRSVTGFVQTEGPHIRQSELCASCHTLITEAFGPDGTVVGSLPEQMNYQEWRHSAFAAEERSCQSCHMPRAPGPVRVSSVLGEPRADLAQHVFVGGNAFMIRMLNRYRAELGVAAHPSELEATARATILQLQRETAEVTASPAIVSNGTLRFDVTVRNLTGHKLPTGYPARRTWLHVSVTDAAGGIVFESGAPDMRGAIAGNDGDLDAARYERHYTEITSPDEVQIYESILGDTGGRPTTGLLTATQYLKDNRLLPRGFDKSTAPAEIGVAGDALGDADFQGGADLVRYAVPLSAPGPLNISVELLYQSIAYRWAHNLEGYDAAEPRQFLSYYRAMATSSPVVIASATTRTNTRP